MLALKISEMLSAAERGNFKYEVSSNFNSVSIEQLKNEGFVLYGTKNALVVSWKESSVDLSRFDKWNPNLVQSFMEKGRQPCTRANKLWLIAVYYHSKEK